MQTAITVKPGKVYTSIILCHTSKFHNIDDTVDEVAQQLATVLRVAGGIPVLNKYL